MKSIYPGAFSLVLSLAVAALFFIPTGINAREGATGAGRGKAVFPNPFTEGTTFELTMPRPARIKIDVYNIRGQHMRNLYGGEQGEEHAAGEYPIWWDGKDKYGNPVPPGVYICALNADGRTIKSVKAIKLEV